jgi:HEAT repeat protein
LLENKNPYLRQVAASALGGVGPPARLVVPALRAALNDEESAVRKAAAEALEKLDSEVKD